MTAVYREYSSRCGGWKAVIRGGWLGGEGVWNTIDTKGAKDTKAPTSIKGISRLSLSKPASTSSAGLCPDREDAYGDEPVILSVAKNLAPLLPQDSSLRSLETPLKRRCFTALALCARTEQHDKGEFLCRRRCRLGHRQLPRNSPETQMLHCVQHDKGEFLCRRRCRLGHRQLRMTTGGPLAPVCTCRLASPLAPRPSLARRRFEPAGRCFGCALPPCYNRGSVWKSRPGIAMR
jgi:hypothetical protein